MAFDLKPDAPPPAPRDLPWGYNETRVTALPRDPRWLYVYWEATDEAITAARAKLGSGGPTAQFALRVYDTTNRQFDGTNANSYFDVPVERVWNNYFIEVNRPRAVFHVEIGMKSSEGYFAAMARSGAAEMPADSVWGDSHPEWMSVLTNQPVPQVRPYRHRYTPGGMRVHWPLSPPPVRPSAGAAPAAAGAAATFTSSWSGEAGRALSFILGGETIQGEWFEQHLSGGFVRWIRWQGGGRKMTWSSGPHRFSLESLGPVQVWFQGERRIFTYGGEGKIVEGPWHVVITGIGAHGERRVLDTWLVRMVWVTDEVLVRIDSPSIYRRIYDAYARRTVLSGASEVLIREEAGSSQELFMGASVQLWLSASELMFGGASETAMLGASEVLALGASETAWLGASEVRWGGASEFVAGGASELQWRGASENLLGGASLFVGASAGMMGGASGGMFVAGSEQRFGAGSESVSGISGVMGTVGVTGSPAIGGPWPNPLVSSLGVAGTQVVLGGVSSGSVVDVLPHRSGLQQAGAGAGGAVRSETAGQSQSARGGRRTTASETGKGQAVVKSGTSVRADGGAARRRTKKSGQTLRSGRQRTTHWLRG